MTTLAQIPVGIPISLARSISKQTGVSVSEWSRMEIGALLRSLHGSASALLAKIVKRYSHKGMRRAAEYGERDAKAGSGLYYSGGLASQYLQGAKTVKRGNPRLRRASAELSKLLHPGRFSGMSPKMAVLVQYFLGRKDWAHPALRNVYVTTDGYVLGEREGDVGANDIIGHVSDLKSNWNRLLDAAELPDRLRKEANRRFLTGLIQGPTPTLSQHEDLISEKPRDNPYVDRIPYVGGSLYYRPYALGKTHYFVIREVLGQDPGYPNKVWVVRASNEKEEVFALVKKARGYPEHWTAVKRLWTREEAQSYASGKVSRQSARTIERYSKKGRKGGIKPSPPSPGSRLNPGYIEVSPAYGREYKTAKAVKADWDAGKDFVIETFGPDTGRYINKEDAQKGNFSNVLIRYKRMTQVTNIKVR